LAETGHDQVIQNTGTVQCLNLHMTASYNKGMILRVLWSNIILKM